MAGANWVVAFITLIVTIAFSVYLQGKGLIGMLPILLGAIVGYGCLDLLWAWSILRRSVQRSLGAHSAYHLPGLWRSRTPGRASPASP